jgi:hypothetical protein
MHMVTIPNISIPSGTTHFFALKTSRPARARVHPAASWGVPEFFLRNKAVLGWRWTLTLSCADVKSKWSYILTPSPSSIRLWRGQGRTTTPLTIHRIQSTAFAMRMKSTYFICIDSTLFSLTTVAGHFPSAHVTYETFSCSEYRVCSDF